MMYLIIGILSLLFVMQIKTENCVTPNKEKTECISLYACPILLKTLVDKQENSTEFVRQSNCGGTPSSPMVCCGSSANFITETNKTPFNFTEKLNLLPTRRYCGFQHSDDYISTINDSLPTITEFPWLAAIIFKYHNDIRPACGGTLINRQYVLTAAHCFTGYNGNLTAVHLGEYNVKNKTDCVHELPFDEECSTPVESFGIEKIILHPMFNEDLNINDIALLRLNRTVTYSDYIRPVCLPLPGTEVAKVGDVLTSSGWGLKHETGDRVEIKKKILNRLIDNEQCANAFKAIYVINENHLCTLQFNQSSNVACRGDSGGPLLFSNRNQWYQEGVISFSKGCRGEDPKVYAKVVNYIDWILENIEK